MSIHLHQYNNCIILTHQLELEPLINYNIRLPQVDDKQCHKLDVKVLQTYIPPQVINLSTPIHMVHSSTLTVQEK